ncbi:hypothetical protein HYC85_017609 [Camellia sinensis]|uniref:Uncharacterized protein n=1 Tax=Camellia sinensis TaxID=4442 RepID=A0A7J7GRW6_CAMSI|nr:hypothetical protein HYC85_017609 [Camellia sinensis]
MFFLWIDSGVFLLFRHVDLSPSSMNCIIIIVHSFVRQAASIDDLFQGTEEGTLFDLERQCFFGFQYFRKDDLCFQFETEIEGGKLRRDVLAEGNVSSGGAPAGIISMLSGEEEMFAFRRAVSRLIEMQTPLYLDGVHYLHPYFQTKHERYESSRASTLQSQQLF